MIMSLAEWYGRRDILFTGITSEVGRLLLEKILRTFPDVTAYTVIRSSSGLLKEDRIKQIFASPGFERLRQQEPNAISRVKIFEGNLKYEDLGLSEGECVKLKNIELVFHTGGPAKDLLNFCENRLPKLRAIAVTSSIFKSGTLSENSIDDEFKSTRAPLVLLRLPVVGPAYKEPLPGFIEILRGPSAIMVGAGFALGRSELPAEVVPVDIAVNALITAAWERGIRGESDGPEVYNIPILGCTWGQLIAKGQLARQKFPYPTFGISGMTSIAFLHLMMIFLFEWLPSIVCDTILSVMGAKPRFFAEYEKVQKSLQSFGEITSKPWSADRKRIYQLEKYLTPQDKGNYLLRCDIDLESYVLCAAASARKNCVNTANITIIRNFKRVFFALTAFTLLSIIINGILKH